MLYRHGDVLVQLVDKIPSTAKKQKHLTLAEGEVTGHSHRIANRDHAELYRDGDQLFLNVTHDPAALIHQEHAQIDLPKGFYRVWRQREYTPERIVIVRD